MRFFLLTFLLPLLTCEDLDPRVVRLLLTNDFEDGYTDPWQDASSGSVQWKIEDFGNSTNTPAPSLGSKYLKATKANPTSSGLAILRSPQWLAKPGDELSVTFWIRSKHLQENSLQIYWVQNGKEELLMDLTSFSSPTNFEWRTRKASIPITEPTLLEIAIYGFCGTNEEDAIALDDIIVGSEDIVTTTVNPPGDCNAVLTETSGVIMSPNYPFHYDNNANCYWQIHAPENYTVELTVVDFSTQAGHDFLTIYDGISVNDPVLLSLTGNTLPSEPAYSSADSMRLQFSADGDNIQSRGFYATYNVTPVIPSMPLECPLFLGNVSVPCYEWNRTCYCLSTFAATWYTADDYCKQHYALLASIETAEEDNFLFSLLPANVFAWTSGTDAETEGSWLWSSTGQPFAYTNWGTGQPDNANRAEHCMHIQSANKHWNDLTCTYSTLSGVPNLFLCEFHLPL